MLDIFTTWVHQVAHLTGTYFTHMNPEKYTHILLFIVFAGWLMLGGSNRR